MKTWCVVYTKPNCERRAFEHLRRQGYEVYLPFHKRRRSHARRVEIVEKPLFPRYLFVAIDLMATRWRPILGTVGVAEVLRYGDAPQVLSHEVIDALRDREARDAFDDIDPVRNLRRGDKVRVLQGPFADLIGRFQSMADGERVNVLLQLLGREVRTRIQAVALATA